MKERRQTIKQRGNKNIKKRNDKSVSDLKPYQMPGKGKGFGGSLCGTG